jgi:hypothetical protein
MNISVLGIDIAKNIFQLRGANYWARVFQCQGHIVKLISPQFVKPDIPHPSLGINFHEGFSNGI